MSDNRPPDITRILAPVRRSLGLKIVLAWTIRGVAVGAAAGALALGLSHLWEWPNARFIGLGCFAVGTCLGAMAGAFRWPSNLQAARSADRYFSLHDRLTTSLELTGASGSMAQLQRADLTVHIQGLSLRRGSHGPLRLHDTTLVAVGIALFLALFAVPPHTQPHVARAASARTAGNDAQRIHKVAILDIPTMIRALETGLTPGQRADPTVRLLKLHLSSLQKQLLQTQSREAALRSISITQNQLQRLDAALHPLTSKSVDQLNRALGETGGKNTNRSGPQDTTQAANRAAGSLRQVATALSHMSASQRLKLARSMRQTDRIISDQALRDRLDKAAIALSHNDIQAAQKYLKQLANALNQRSKNTATHKLLQQMQRALNRAKGRLASLSLGQQNRQTGKTSGRTKRQGNRQSPPPGGSGSSQGGGPSNGAQQRGGLASTRNGTGRQSAPTEGNNQNTRNGNVTGIQPRTGGQGGNIISETPTARNQQSSGKFAKVFVPGKLGRGPVSSQTGPNSAPRQSHFLPYRQILVQYRRDARSALERANLPPDEQSYIRRYFTAISAK